MQTGELLRDGRSHSFTIGRSTKAMVLALRPRQWIKNGLLFVPLAFTPHVQQPDMLLRTTVAAILFCALSSAGYLLNDVADVEADRNHPTKRLRPIASGEVPIRLAVVLGAVLALGGALGCLAMRPELGLTAFGYLVLTAAYTLRLKHIVLVDIFGIAAGFVLRAAAGGAAIEVPISPWLYTATLLGALLIALGKRRAELLLLGEDAGQHRRNLEAYSLKFVDQLVLLIAGAALMTYALYTFSAENLPRDHSMMLTIPLVLFGLFRYLFLLQGQHIGGAPEELLFRDRPLLAASAAWAVLAMVILRLGARA
jgi:4-hydroxybenzoate polyprenyltransferase